MLLAVHSLLIAQKQPLTYFLPDISYDASIPTPEKVLGYQVGEWHVSHDQLLNYFRTLAAASDRIKLVETGRTYENRPLINLIITSKANHDNLASIQSQHIALSDPEKSGSLDISKMPAVLYQGFSIHGNEASGANGALLVAYYLAAGQSPHLEKLLSETVIIFDPCLNPDGLHRFSTWVNMHKNVNLTDDSADREYSEAWPGGRTNHYWFDLNRDWLVTIHPESQARIRTFHAWKPNVLTDHHEMGSNSTFFFMPGIQSRINPITPKKNQELTARLGEYHAKALDKIGSLYFTEEGFDDFYFGKGSTFPDANACIGILFEQASSRGHLQATENGLLSFAFTIRNQVTTALSTQEGVLSLRTELLEFQRDFYKNAIKDAKADDRKAFIVGEKYDHARLATFIDMLKRQQIKVYELSKKVTLNGKDFEPGSACIIPLEQTQNKLIHAFFQRDVTFEDSIFYDVSAWTMPLAFNLQYETLNAKSYSSSLLGQEISTTKLKNGQVMAVASDYAFAFEWDEYYAPAALYHLLKNGVMAKVATKPFTGILKNGEKEFTYGTIVIQHQNQSKSAAEIFDLLKEAALIGHINVYGLTTGLTPVGIDLGSGNMEVVRQPKIALIVGEGSSSNDIGELWHLLDTRYNIPVTKVEASNLSSSNIDRFNVIIMASGNYNRLNAETLKTWLNAGGVLIGTETAVRWLADRQLANVEFKKPKENPSTGVRPYASSQEDRGALSLAGSIFETEIDLTHPLGYGFRNKRLPMFRTSGDFLEPAQNVYAMPSYYTSKPLMAGYAHPTHMSLAGGSASIIVSGVGSGKVISMSDNPNFRAFWYGNNKLLANAVFFGNTISGMTVERPRKKE